MPNYVKNIIRFSKDTPQEKINELFQTVVVINGNDEPCFDFNRLIPMPESLNIVSGSRTEKAMKLYRTIQSLKELGETAAEKAMRMSKIAQLFQEPYGKEMYALGERACNNVKLYGFADWYGWCCANWGTKWNSFNVEIDKENRRVSFCTAWYFPEPIAIALTKRFPDVYFTWDYANEDAGYGTGELTYEEGEISPIEFDDGSDEAYQMYKNCWSDDDLYKDEDGHWKSRMLEDECD